MYTPPNPVEVGEVLGAPLGFVLQTIVPVGLAGEDKVKEPRMGVGEAVFVDGWVGGSGMASFCCALIVIY